MHSDTFVLLLLRFRHHVARIYYIGIFVDDKIGEPMYQVVNDKLVIQNEFSYINITYCFRLILKI